MIFPLCSYAQKKSDENLIYIIKELPEFSSKQNMQHDMLLNYALIDHVSERVTEKYIDQLLKIENFESNLKKQRYFLLSLSFFSLFAVIYIILFIRHKIKNLAFLIINKIHTIQGNILSQEENLNEFISYVEKLNRERNDGSLDRNDGSLDRSTILKILGEIHRIKKNISFMSEDTKGLKQILASISRMQLNLEANDFELIDLLGINYDDGMKVDADFIFDEESHVGKRVITKVMRPQINFKGKMIQSARVEVTCGREY